MTRNAAAHKLRLFAKRLKDILVHGQAAVEWDEGPQRRAPAGALVTGASAGPGEAFARAYAFTLTIVANAMHVGDHLKERLG